MLLVQKYNSLDEIDSEFKDSLEVLLASELPSLNQLNDFEKRSPEKLVFYYYLFFGHQHNRPVGMFFAQFFPLPDDEFLSFKERMLKKIKKTPSAKLMRLTGPGVTNSCWCFEPKHEAQGLKEIAKILSELRTPEVLMAEEICTSIHGSLIKESTHRESSKVLLAPFVLKNNSYETYFNGLAPEEKNQLKNLWKNITQNKNLEICEITESFKLPKVARPEGISNYLKLDSTFIGLQENGQTKGLIIFTKGVQKKLFVDFVVVNHSDAYSPMAYLQNALMKAFELGEFEQLIFSANPASSETYLALSIEALEAFRIPHIQEQYSFYVLNEELKQNIQQNSGRYDLSKYTTGS